MSKAKRDPYDVLGVPRDVNQDELKKAYKKLARQYHPDANPGDKSAEEKFKEVSESYSILSDPDKRAAYDRLGWGGLDATAGGTGGDPFSGFGFGDIFNSFFGDIFGSRGGSGYTQARQTTGRSIRFALEVTFEEAAIGVTKNITITKHDLCPTCNGNRAAPGTSPKRCNVCGGSGRERIQQRTPFGYMINETACRTCQGLGEIIDHPCPECKGAGLVEQPKKITVEIPAGINDGQRIVIRGEGEPGLRGNPPGDLFVYIRLKPHKYFQREGNELIYEKTINIAQAALGDTIQVPTLIEGEKAKLKIPSGTMTNTIFRLRGKGFPNVNGFGKGDMHIIVKIDTPKRLSPREKELLTELKEIWKKSSSEEDT